MFANIRNALTNAAAAARANVRRNMEGGAEWAQANPEAAAATITVGAVVCGGLGTLLASAQLTNDAAEAVFVLGYLEGVKAR